MKIFNALTLSVFADTANKTDYSQYKKVDIFLKEGQQEVVNSLLGKFSSVYVWSQLENKLTFSVSKDEYKIIAEEMEKTNVDSKVAIENIKSIIDVEMKKRDGRKDEDASTFGYFDYLDYPEYIEWLENVIVGHGPDLISRVSIGTTHEGRDIPAIRIPGDNRNLGKPGIALDCGIHAREWISPAMCRLFIHEMMKCSEPQNAGSCDPVIRDEFMEFQWFIIPMMNPDGYQYTWDNNRLWRKNTKQSETGPCMGTDLNRNSDVAWGTIGASDNSCSDTYRGDGPVSEEEIKAYQVGANLADVFSNKNVKASVSFHSYSQKIISSFAVSREVFAFDPATIDLMNASGKLISEAMTAQHNQKYDFGQSRDILYPSSGSSKDWALVEKDVPLAWTWELRDTGNYGFILPSDQIEPQFDEVKAGLIALFKYIKENMINE